MENKCSKSKIFVNERIFSDNFEVAIDADFTLPDYCPDVSKIFKCQSEGRIISKSVNGKTVTLDGIVILNLIYCDKNSRLYNYVYEYPFSKSVELNNETIESIICAKIKIDYINCRAVTGRKIDIHGAAGIFLRVMRKRPCEVLSDYQDNTVELKKDSTVVITPMGYCEKYITIEEDIPLNAPANISNIIRNDANIDLYECKIIKDKAIIKGNVCISLLYCVAENNKPQSLKCNIPFSQILDVEGINETCESDIKCEIANFEIKTEHSQTGECKAFGIVLKLLISCEGYCQNETPVILDAFSRRNNAEIKNEIVNFDRIIENIHENQVFKANLRLDDEIESVVDLWTKIKSVNVHFEDNVMTVFGILSASAVLCGEDHNTYYCEKPLEFEYKYSVDGASNLYSDPEVNIIDCSYTITDSKTIELRVNLSIKAVVYEQVKLSVITDLLVDKSSPKAYKKSSAMTIYFPCENECVWDIARTYNASVDEIMKINELSSDKLKSGMMLIVPVV